MEFENVSDKANRITNFMFRHYADIKQAVEEVRKDASHMKSGGNSGKAWINDPTASVAIRSVTPIKHLTLPNGDVVQHPEEWLHIIEISYKAALAELERMAVKDYYSGNTAEAVAAKYKVARQTVYDWKQELLVFAVQYACQLGIVYVVREKRA